MVDIKAFNIKNTGDTLEASEWNELTSYANSIARAVNNSGNTVDTGSNSGSSVVSVTDETVSGGDATVGVSVASGNTNIGSAKIIELTKKKKGINTTLTSGNNINVEPRESVGTTKGGNIAFKPGDDIELCSHHRLVENQDEVSVKVMDGSDNPVKLQIQAANLTLSTKNKNKTKTKDGNGDDTTTAMYNDPDVMNINVTTGSGKGYLKVRARAIDLRCEEHGGIALQPKGTDSDGHMNKIKFEHGGGDGLEFGTFNTEKTSIFTDEYRFNKDGVWKMATREKEAAAKADLTDPTTSYTYKKQADDFYDVISSSDKTTTTEDIINTASAFNNGGITSALEYDLDIASQTYFKYTDDAFLTDNVNEIITVSTDTPVGSTHPFELGRTYTASEIAILFHNWILTTNTSDVTTYLNTRAEVSASYGIGQLHQKILARIDVGRLQFVFEVVTPNIKLRSLDGAIVLDANKGINFIDSVCYAGKNLDVVSCSMYDIIKLVNYMKTAGQGPWANS